MDVSTIGRVCYRQFTAERIVKTLERMDVFRDLRTRRLTGDEAELATKRASKRVDTYYHHLQNLLDGVQHNGQKRAITRIDALHTRDKGWLGDIYQRLAQTDAGDLYGTPG